MQTIWKYPLRAADKQTVSMPKGAKILCAQTQGQASFEQVCLWASIPDEKIGELVERTILIIGTGHRVVSIPKTYIGTVQLRDGSLVFHIFEEDTK